MTLALFHPLVQEWFRGRFEGPTPAQELGWPAIAQGRHTLIAAPTGSGKTLAAFLICLDRLVRAGLEGRLPQRTEVVYVSPLKALSNDIQRNLADPLAEIAALAQSHGTPLPEITVAVRTGDTPARERQALVRRPPHILVTTPESLFILLTSESGRRALAGVRTLILDEIHAVADDKRGSHLSLSVERLCALAEGPVTRIGLSATQRPIEEVARLLVGAQEIAPDGVPACAIVDTGHARALDLAVELVEGELGPIATHEQWGRVLDSVGELAQAHRTTLVFVNTRRLVERVAHQLSLRLGEEAVVAHHGSLSYETRHAAEQRLKAGQVRVCVATSSLELGIDIGAVDLVCQIGSPRSIGLLIQRVGRSGHAVGAMPKGRLFPLTRDELLECAALLRAVRRGNLDRLTIPPWPLDVLAQQIVAECACREWEEDALYDLCRRAYPYRALPREWFDQVVEILSHGVAPREGRSAAYLHRDGVHRRLRGRRGARLAALTSGGAIPDTADYDVIAEPEGTFVGKVNEDFAVESVRGDVFLLGNTPWRILRVESGRVRVEDAQGAVPSVPFWLGEAPGRTVELSDELSDLREELDLHGEQGDGVPWLVGQVGLGQEAAQQAVAYLEEGKRILRAVPTKRRVVAERFFDESGGLQLVLHAPFGSRINRAWGMALRKEICRTFDFELQAAATDDGINLSLGPSMTFPLSDVFQFISSRRVEEVLVQAILQAPLFGIRWRWDAARSLALLRFAGGRKVPPPLLRMRSQDLLAAVFPAQVACQDNAMPADIELPDHPLVFETVRDCLTEAMDVDGLKAVLLAMEKGEIELFARDTPQPSVFSHQILNAMPYAFLDDAPLEERRARAVTLRRALPEDARDLGALDPQAIARAAQEAWPVVRDPHELHDALLSLVLLPEGQMVQGMANGSVETWQGWFESLVQDGRAVRASYGDSRTAWVAAEATPLVEAALPGVRFHPLPPPLPPRAGPASQEEPGVALIRGWVESMGPFTPTQLASTLGLERRAVETAVAYLEATGTLLRGRFTPGTQEEEFCDRRILARIHRYTIDRLRREVEPVPAATFMRFLSRWQNVSAASRLQGSGGLLEAVEQLQGFEAAAGAWESEILSSRVSDYDAAVLDRLCLGGEVVWGRFLRRDPTPGDPAVTRAVLTRTSPLSLGLREALPWLLEELSADESRLSGAAQEVRAFLAQRGASFLSDIASTTRRLPSDVEEALWQLAAAGHVTADAFWALRGRVDGVHKRQQRSPRFRRRSAWPVSPTRWSLLQAFSPAEDAAERRAMQLLARYGVIFPELLAREPGAPSWRSLLQVYRRAEARGEIRGGRFVAGFIGEQFALPEAVELLRRVHKTAPSGELVAVSACDPLNLTGILPLGPRVPAVLGNRVVFRDGVPVASLQAEASSFYAELEEPLRVSVLALLLSCPSVALSSEPEGSSRN